jgi:hypothetical protein
MLIKDDKDSYIVSRPRGELFVANYIDKIGIIIIIVAFLLQRLFFPLNGLLLTNWLKVIVIILAISCIQEMVLRKFAYRISFNIKTGEVTFSLYRGKGAITMNIKEIKEIYVNCHITFKLGDQKILFNGVVDRQLVQFLENLMPITRGPFVQLIHKWW